MKRLVVFYSRSGNTKKVAQMIAEKLGADIEEVIDKKKRSGVLGFISGGKDAVFNAVTEIQTPKYNPMDYEEIIIGTPVWADKMAPAIRTYLSKYSITDKKIGLFCTTAKTGINDTLESMEVFLNKNTFIAEAGFTANDIKDPQALGQKLEKLCGNA